MNLDASAVVRIGASLLLRAEMQEMQNGENLIQMQYNFVNGE